MVLGFLGIWVLGNLADAVGSAFGDGGAAIAVVVLGLLVCGLVVLRWRLRLEHPWVWWPVFGAPAAIVRMVWTWRATCEGLGLSVPAKRFARSALVSTGSGRGGGFGRRGGGGLIVQGEPLTLIAPRRVGLRVNGCALVVTVRLHPGQTPHDWDRAAEAFAHQWRVHRVRSVSKRSGFVTLTGLGFDPLRHPPTPKPGKGPEKAGSRALAGSEEPLPQRPDYAVVPEVLAVPVGVTEEGSVWEVDLSKRPHHLVTGATRSGKSTLTVRLLGELAQRPVGLVGIDAKNGMELARSVPGSQPWRRRGRKRRARWGR